MRHKTKHVQYANPRRTSSQLELRVSISVSMITRMTMPLAASFTMSFHSVAAFIPSAHTARRQRHTRKHAASRAHAQLMPQPLAKLDCDWSPISL